MEVQATAKNVRISPRKVRLVIDVVRGKRVNQALATLQFMPQKAAREVYKVVKSAAANAENNHDLDAEALIVKRIFANEGPTLKRFRPRSRGRVSPLLKRSSHITAIVEEVS